MKSGEINSLFKNLSKVIENPRSDLKYKNKFTIENKIFNDISRTK